MKTTFLMASVSALAALAFVSGAQAKTVHTKTVVDMKKVDGVNEINFSIFDINQDGVYSMSEVGEKLFYVFDQDGNEVIDNLEWDRRSMYTITPMEKTTYKYVDFDDDGQIEASAYDYDTFYKTSGLIRFDKDKDGLSASEFIDYGFNALDDNDNNMIEVDEWKEAYIASVLPETAEPERYNN